MRLTIYKLKIVAIRNEVNGHAIVSTLQLSFYFLGGNRTLIQFDVSIVRKISIRMLI
jgi:hypothetical protein